MFPEDLLRYVAAGCLVVDKPQTKALTSIWSPVRTETAQWRHLGLPFLAPELQNYLLSSSVSLARYARLLRKG